MKHTVRAQHVIFIIEPDIWIVAHSGIVKPAISSLTPFFMVRRSVTGIVAALDDVPKAVKYAGNMFIRSLNGLRREKPPAMRNSYTNIIMCKTNITQIIFAKTARI